MKKPGSDERSRATVAGKCEKCHFHFSQTTSAAGSQVGGPMNCECDKMTRRLDAWMLARPRGGNALFLVGLIDSVPTATKTLRMFDSENLRARSREGLFLLGDDLATYQEQHPLLPDHLRLLRCHEEVPVEMAIRLIAEHNAFLETANRLISPRPGRLRG